MSWSHKIDLSGVFHNETMSFAERRDAIVRRIKAAKCYNADDDELNEILDSLADSDGATVFDDWWDDFYNWADDRRVWVKTR